MSNFKMRVRYRIAGGHVHMRVFTGNNIPGVTLGKAGDLTMTLGEFQAWLDNVVAVEFEPEDER